ncbi:MAG: diacylglycerol kinase family protein [Proteobacteria bacterium]|nr:diacylglycerol kinase family protein [Pseudomonadota bacterium]
MKKIGVLSNPLSRSNLKHLRAIEEYIHTQESICHRRLDVFTDLRSILAEFSARKIEILVINGGDGTVSAVLTEIYEHEIFEPLPIIAILPGGTSNTIAGDVGLKGDRVAALQRLVDTLAAARVEEHIQIRPLLRVQYDLARPAVVGMFFGTAAICDAISLRRRIFPQKWIPDALAGALTLVAVLANVIAGRIEKVLPGRRIEIIADGETGGAGTFSLLIITTLRRIFLGSKPFWGTSNGRLRMTRIESPAPGLVRHAFRLLYGRDKQNLRSDFYQSANADRIELRMHCPFNIDGEFFQPTADCSVVLTSSLNARFLQC